MLYNHESNIILLSLLFADICNMHHVNHNNWKVKYLFCIVLLLATYKIGHMFLLYIKQSQTLLLMIP